MHFNKFLYKIMSKYFQYMHRYNYLIITKNNKYEYNLTAITRDNWYNITISNYKSNL